MHGQGNKGDITLVRLPRTVEDDDAGGGGSKKLKPEILISTVMGWRSGDLIGGVLLFRKNFWTFNYLFSVTP